MITKAQRLAALEEMARLKNKKETEEALLPHLYGLKHYTWSREFFESRNRRCFLTAANQIGKSTINIRKIIHFATATHLWPALWDKGPPKQMWYLYPTKDVATSEFKTKWIGLLPQGKMKDDPKYGWEVNYENKKVFSIELKSGVMLYFKTYGQDVQYLQSGTCDYIAADEELPFDLYDELQLRLFARKGYFTLVFTATLGQEEWRLTMQERGTPSEKFPEADKWQISMYECLVYEDGSPGAITDQDINVALRGCSTESEQLKRIWGLFVLTAGRKYESFSIQDNCAPRKREIPKGHFGYAAIDYGSGGARGHPAAICIIAVNATLTKGRVVRAWRGDKMITSSPIILKKYAEMRAEVQELGLPIVQSVYDHSAPDLNTVATGMGIALMRADKGHDRGEGVLNGLFKNRMLELDSDDPEVMKMAQEFLSLRSATIKKNAKDDLIDTARYAAVAVPWNWSDSSITKLLSGLKKVTENKTDSVRDWADIEPPKPDDSAYEFEEWNEAYER